MSQAAYHTALGHHEKIGAVKGALWGILVMLSVLIWKGVPGIIVVYGVFALAYLWLVYTTWKRHEHFQALHKATLAVADEYEIYLRATILGALVKVIQAEVAGEQFERNSELTPKEIDGIIEKAMRESARRPEALAKLGDALKLIDEALDIWAGKYPNHTLNQMLETLEAIRTAEERRAIRIIPPAQDKSNPVRP
jgi:hypothetical protein